MVLRDRLYEAVEATCRELNISALVNKSADFVYPAWISLEAWQPAGPGATHRVFSSFEITPKPHSKYEFEMSIHWTRDGKKKNGAP